MDDPTCLSQSMTCLHGFDAIFAWPFCIPIFSTHEPMNRFQQEQQSLLPTLPLSRSFVGIPERSSIFWRRGLDGPAGMVIIGWNKRQMVNRWSTRLMPHLGWDFWLEVSNAISGHINLSVTISWYHCQPYVNHKAQRRWGLQPTASLTPNHP